MVKIITAHKKPWVRLLAGPGGKKKFVVFSQKNIKGNSVHSNPQGKGTIVFILLKENLMELIVVGHCTYT